MEELDPNKFHTLSVKNKKLLMFTGIFVFLVGIPLFLNFYYNLALKRPAQGFKQTQFEIFGGEDVSSISDRLYESELINSAFLFKFYLLTQNLHTNIQAGVYNIPAGASVLDLAELFQHGTNDVLITFPEGLRVEEYALLASNAFKRVDYAGFVQLAKDREGHLFPDTYYFNVDIDETTLVEKLTDNFNLKTEEILTKSVLDKVGLTKEQVIILASIIEREVSNSDDKKVVAGILLKRFRNGDLLGADATTQYAVAKNRFCLVTNDECPNQEQAGVISWWPNDLTLTELNSDSPYNTRKNLGLPPTPISNPGLDSIEAVLEYKDSPYYFYLNDSSGNTHFSTTLSEHQKNIEKYLQ